MNQAIKIQTIAGNCVKAIVDGTEICFADTSFPDWQDFAGTYNSELEDLLNRFILSREEEDFIWLSASKQGFFLFGLLWDAHSNVGQGMLCNIPDRFNDINEAYWTESSKLTYTARLSSFARELYQFLQDSDGFNVSSSFPFFCEHLRAERRSKTLVVKIPKHDHRLKLISFDAFSAFEFGCFGRYKMTLWAVSDKPLMIQWKEKQQIEKQLKNSELLVSKSLFIVNTYADFFKDEGIACLINRAISYLKELASSFSLIDFNGTKHALRMRFNPTEETILEDFLSYDTWFVFADFHTVQQQWTLDNRRENTFFHELTKSDLSHIQLMKIFHCYSAKWDEGNDSIVSKFLKTGVKQVEGCNAEENFLDFLRTILHLLVFVNQDYVRLYDWKMKQSLLSRGKDLFHELSGYRQLDTIKPSI